MSQELQTKLNEAEAAAAKAGKELEQLKAEQAQVNEALNTPSRDFDVLAELKRRQQALPEAIFTARVASGKANLVVMQIRRDIALEARQEAVQRRQEQEPSLNAEIAEAEKKVMDLKMQRSSLLDAITNSDREAATYMSRIYHVERDLQEYIQGASFDPESFKRDKPNVVTIRPTQIVGSAA
jgi:hypothetical protein